MRPKKKEKKKENLENRHYIKTLGEILLLTVMQNVAQTGLRKDDDDLNQGKLRRILRFVTKHDLIITDRVKNGPKNEKYTSASILNDTLASMAREEIAQNVRSYHYSSVQADEAKKASKSEQLALVIRYYDEAS